MRRLGLLAALLALLMPACSFSAASAHTKHQQTQQQSKSQKAATKPMATITDSLSPPIPITSVKPVTLARGRRLHLEGIDFLTDKTGFAVGHIASAGQVQSVLATTKDGGATWTRTTPQLPVENSTKGQSALLLRLHMLTPLHGFAIAGEQCEVPVMYGVEGCAGFAILETEDGGTHFQLRWAKMSGSTAAGNLRELALAFPNDHAAYALVGGEVLTSVDGGHSWKALPLPVRSFQPMGMAWVSGKTGFVVGGVCGTRAFGCHEQVLQTTDGGAHFKSVKMLQGLYQPTAGIAFASPTTGAISLMTVGKRDNSSCEEDCIAISQAELFVTTDGGAHWLERYDKSVPETTLFGPPAMKGTAIAVPTGNAGAEIAPVFARPLFSVDDGLHWQKDVGSPNWAVSQIVFTSPGNLWAIGQAGYGPASFLVHSGNSGKTFIPSPLTLAPRTAIDFVDAEHGFGTGAPFDPSALLATSDGGHSWQLAATWQGYEPILDLSFVNQNLGYVIAHNIGTSGAGLYSTSDGGRRWHLVHRFEPTRADITALRFVDARHGAVVIRQKDADAIMVTSDGGQHWSQPQRMPVPSQSSPMVRLGSAAATWGLIWHQSGTSDKANVTLKTSADGGHTWQTAWALKNVVVPDRLVYLRTEKDVWLYLDIASKGSGQGLSPRLLHTTDGGKYFTELRFPTIQGGISISDLSFAGPKNGWMLTAHGLYATTDGGLHWLRLAPDASSSSHA